MSLLVVKMAWRERCNNIMDTLNNLAEVVGRQAEAMRAMGENMQASQGRETPVPTPSPVLVATAVPYKQFMAMNPPSFDGKSSPEAAEDWIREIERIFRVLQVSDDRKVDFGTYRLRKDAERWWATTLDVRFAGGAVTWEQFVEVFYAAYFPTHERSRKMQEFLDLQQGNSTLADYITKFRSLERFCPHVYVTEKERAMKFARGLKLALRLRVITRAPSTLEEALETATLLEQEWIESQKTPQSRGKPQQIGQKSWPKKRSYQQNSGGKKSAPPAKRNHQNNNRQRQNRQPQQQQQNQVVATSGCPKCRMDHPGRPCPRDVGGCIYCGKMGHYIRDCRKKQSDDLRRNTPGTSQPAPQRLPQQQRSNRTRRSNLPSRRRVTRRQWQGVPTQPLSSK